MACDVESLARAQNVVHAKQARDFLDSRSLPTHWSEKCYQAVIRRFKTGQVEVSTSLVRPMQRLAQGKRWQDHYPVYPALETESETPEQIEQRKKDNRARAIRRARQHVRWQVKSIGADHLLTLTYRLGDKPMDDVGRLKADWQRFVRLVRKGLPASANHLAHHGLKEWQFVAIREKQNNGAYHLHVAVVGRQDISFIRRCWYVAIGGAQDDAGEGTLGQINVRGPSKRWGSRTFEWRPDKLSGYMTKYLHKAFDELESDGSKRYWASKFNDKCSAQRVWLAATSFVEAARETWHLAVDAVQGSWCTLWGSHGMDALWAAGPHIDNYRPRESEWQ